MKQWQAKLTELFLSHIFITSYRTCLPSIPFHKSIVPIEKVYHLKVID